MRTRRRSLTAVSLAMATAAGLVGLAAPAQSAVSTKFQVPFACGERWEGTTRSHHSPSALSIDFNQANDHGKLVLTSERGVVASVTDLGGRSYGLYVVIDHGGGWSTLYAHLSKSLVAPGQVVDQGQPIALLGNSGGSLGAHLHYEQRLYKTVRHAWFNAAKFVYNTWIVSRNCPDVPLAGDWNGDRMTDVGVFSRLRLSTFRQRNPDGTVTNIRFGAATDTPLTGDWNGDGQSELGIWTAKTATFTLRSFDGTMSSIVFGDANDLPVTGDWNGDGRADLGIYDSATRTFRLRDARGLITSRRFGATGGLPISGDWDGDGRWNLGVYTPANATFTLLNHDSTTTSVALGDSTSIPVMGDWNGDGLTDVAVWAPATGTFMLRLTPRRTATVAYGTPR